MFGAVLVLLVSCEGVPFVWVAVVWVPPARLLHPLAVQLHLSASLCISLQFGDRKKKVWLQLWSRLEAGLEHQTIRKIRKSETASKPSGTLGVQTNQRPFRLFALPRLPFLTSS